MEAAGMTQIRDNYGSQTLQESGGLKASNVEF